MGKRLAGDPCKLVTKDDRTIPAVFQWLNRSRLLLLALSWGAPPALAHGAERILACPAQLLGQPLRNGQVMAGQPQDIAILQGDEQTARRGNDTRVIWHVQYLYRDGGQVSLECEYAKVGKAYLSIPTQVKTCEYTEHHDRVRLACK